MDSLIFACFVNKVNPHTWTAAYEQALEYGHDTPWLHPTILCVSHGDEKGVQVVLFKKRHNAERHADFAIRHTNWQPPDHS